MKKNKNNNLIDITTTKWYKKMDAKKQKHPFTKKEKTLMRKGRLWESKVSVNLKILIGFDREVDGRWIASVSCVPGMMCMSYGKTRNEAQRKLMPLIKEAFFYRWKESK